MADGAAADRAHNAVMTGIVAGDAACNSAFQAAFATAGAIQSADARVRAAATVANFMTNIPSQSRSDRRLLVSIRSPYTPIRVYRIAG